MYASAVDDSFAPQLLAQIDVRCWRPPLSSVKSIVPAHPPPPLDEELDEPDDEDPDDDDAPPSAPAPLDDALDELDELPPDALPPDADPACDSTPPPHAAMNTTPS